VLISANSHVCKCRLQCACMPYLSNVALLAANSILVHAQISTMSAELPDRLHALWYPITSIGSALLLGIAIYGGPAWARM